MSNNTTDQIHLATKQYVSGIILFNKRLLPIPGWSQITFRGHTCVHVIPPEGTSPAYHPAYQADKARVWNGDVVICVSDHPREYPLVGTVSTKDNYKRLYDFSLEIVVMDPKQVAIAYNQEKDPAGRAIAYIKQCFENAAYRYTHDQITQGDWPVEEWSKRGFSDTGLIVRQKARPTFRMDPYYTELNKLRKEQEEKKEKIQYEYDIIKQRNGFEFKKKALERDFIRQEEVKDQIHQICGELLQVVGAEMKTTLQERIRDGFERGDHTSEIWDEVFTVLYLLGDESQQINLEQRISAHMDNLRQKKEQVWSSFEDVDTTVNTDPALHEVEIDTNTNGA